MFLIKIYDNITLLLPYFSGEGVGKGERISYYYTATSIEPTFIFVHNMQRPLKMFTTEWRVDRLFLWRQITPKTTYVYVHDLRFVSESSTWFPRNIQRHKCTYLTSGFECVIALYGPIISLRLMGLTFGKSHYQSIFFHWAFILLKNTFFLNFDIAF